ncbi:MAG: YdcF family protein [Clostridia bacterium]|nr:YdcF family protein [Clostridia bacterium]
MKKTSSRFVNFLFLVAGIACLLYWLANGLIVRFNQSLLWLWPLMGGICILRWLIVGRRIRRGKGPILRGSARILWHIVLLAGLILFTFVEGTILTAAIVPPQQNLPYIVVLGAWVNGTTPSGALRNRIQVASEYMKENPQTIAIASGGKGDDEGISEAECIFRELVARGIEENRIVLEDTSTSTVENLRNSYRLIEGEDTPVGIVTNNFHICRAMRIARRTGDRPCYPVPVATSWLSLPHNMLREFFAVVADTVRTVL